MVAIKGRKPQPGRRSMSDYCLFAVALLTGLAWPAVAAGQNSTALAAVQQKAGPNLQATGSIAAAATAPQALPRQTNMPWQKNPRSIKPAKSHRPRLRGLVTPKRQAKISSAIAARITYIGPDNGEHFQKGDTLVKFDCGIYTAELNRAKAVAEAAADTLSVKAKLARSGSISRLQAIVAGAEVKKSRAEVLVAKAKVAHCEILAPFSGRVIQRIANAYETVAARDPLLDIVDDQEVEIRVFVPSNWLRWLKLGTRFQFKIDETGAVVGATVIALGASIDSVSQLIELRAALVRPQNSAPAPRLLAGMSGNAYFAKSLAVTATATTGQNTARTRPYTLVRP